MVREGHQEASEDSITCQTCFTDSALSSIGRHSWELRCFSHVKSIFEAERRLDKSKDINVNVFSLTWPSHFSFFLPFLVEKMQFRSSYLSCNLLFRRFHRKRKCGIDTLVWLSEFHVSLTYCSTTPFNSSFCFFFPTYISPFDIPSSNTRGNCNWNATVFIRQYFHICAWYMGFLKKKKYVITYDQLWKLTTKYCVLIYSTNDSIIISAFPSVFLQELYVKTFSICHKISNLELIFEVRKHVFLILLLLIDAYQARCYSTVWKPLCMVVTTI